MKKSKGQVTMFMIVGILLLFIVIVLFIAVKEIIKENNANVPTEMLPIKNHVDGCLEMVSSKSLSLLGLQNGISPNNPVEIDSYKFNAIYSPEDILRLDEMEGQLSEYVKANLPDCIDGFSAFPNMQIKDGEIKVDTQINMLDVTFDIDYRIELSVGGKKHTIDEFSSTQDIRLEEIQEIMKNATEIYYSSNAIELYDYLGSLELNTTIYPVDGKKFFILEDDRSKLNNHPYKYIFALS